MILERANRIKRTENCVKHDHIAPRTQQTFIAVHMRMARGGMQMPICCRCEFPMYNQSARARKSAQAHRVSSVQSVAFQ